MNNFSQYSTILLLGYGREGVATHNFIRAHGFSGQLHVYDQQSLTQMNQNLVNLLQSDPSIQLHLGEDIHRVLQEPYDLIIKTPGIPNKLISANLLSRISSATQLFFDNCPGTIVGVTGTKGKSTTSSLIAAMLKVGQKDVVLVGNIGEPALNVLPSINPNTIVVFELSSHQLSLLHSSPHVAVLLGIYPEHLDYYASFAEYVAAKSRIVKYQKSDDFVIYPTDNQPVVELVKISPAQHLPLTMQTLKNAQMWMEPSQLQGEMNLTNIALASLAAQIFGVAPTAMAEAVKNFHPLAHRLELVGEYRQITFYNDSLATIPQATISALNALGQKVETLILGGYDRHLNFAELAQDLLHRPYLSNFIFFPTTGPKIWQAIVALNQQAAAQYKYIFVDNMADAVTHAYQLTSPGKICLMSPASTSFSLFKDYRDRGDQFKHEIVKQATAR